MTEKRANGFVMQETQQACSNAKMHVKGKYTVTKYHISHKTVGPKI